MSRVASLREAEAARRRGGSMAVFCLYVRAPTQRIVRTGLITHPICVADIQQARCLPLLPRVEPARGGLGRQTGPEADVWLSLLAEAARGEDVAQKVRATRHLCLCRAPVRKRECHGVRRGGGFYACSTNTFKLNYYEPPSGLRFILTTDLGAGDMRESLRHIYSNIYVEYLSKNPLWKPDEELTCPLFTQTLERYIATIS